jgi:hypothetical protein
MQYLCGLEHINRLVVAAGVQQQIAQFEPQGQCIRSLLQLNARGDDIRLLTRSRAHVIGALSLRTRSCCHQECRNETGHD